MCNCKITVNMRLYKYFMISFLFILSNFGCKNISSNPDKKLEIAIHEIIKSDTKVLDLNKVTDFEWDTLLILHPYSTLHQVEKKLNIDLSQIKQTAIESRDDISVLIFYHNRKITKIVEYPRYPGDFAENKIEFIPRKQAIFNVITTTQRNLGGDIYIKLIKK